MYPTNPEEDDLEEDLEIEEEDEQINDEIEEEEREPLFPFSKMPYQEKGENEIHDYEMGSDQELNLGESENRTRRRTLRDERGAGSEP